MPHRRNAALLLFFLGLAAPALAQQPAPAMSLSGTAFTDTGIIPDRFSRKVAAPVSPALAWANAPAGTVSFTLYMHDPDTSPNKGSFGVLHWLAFNIPANVRALPENVPTTPTTPDGMVQAKTTGGAPGYYGPGARGPDYHHYVFELFALDTRLPLGPDASRADVLAAMEGHVVGKAAMVGRFHQ